MNYTLFQADPSHFVKIPQTEDIDTFVVLSLRYLIQYILRNIANSVVITISTTAPAPELFFHDVMAKLFATWGFMAVQLVVYDSKRPDTEVPGRRFCNLIMVDSFENLQRTNLSKHNSMYDAPEYYIIFLQIRDAWMPPHRDKILKYCLDNYWIHCNLMLQNSKGQVLVYTYFPFREEGCYGTDPVLINEFNGERFVNEIMFPNKMKNFYGCPLRLSVWNVPPFLTIPMNASEKLDGLEMVILKTLSNDMNFTIDVDSYDHGINMDTYQSEAFELVSLILFGNIW